MKKALRIIVPLVLVIAVLASTAWYFLIYDRQLTKDIILWGARTLEERGNQEAAAWMYDLAYSQSSQEDTVAIELSEQYREYGNYTKAEYTLTEAISENPTPDLYIALSKLYVEQDKLLDAVNMLDTVHDPQIRATLEAQRPLAPTVSYEPGFYTQYISVEVLCNNGTPYVSTEEQYPSIVTDRYEAPISLGLGDTVLHCLCVGDNGLVSPLAMFGYTVGGVVEEVVFADTAVEASVRGILGVAAETPIMSNQLWDITSFHVPVGVSSLADLKYMLFLEELTIENAPNGQLNVLTALDHLTSLTIIDTAINAEELEYIGDLTTLQQLTMSGCNIVTVNALADLTGLTYLDLSNNTIRNIQAIANMTKLEELYLRQNALTDLTHLAELDSLKTLDVSHNSLTTIAPIFGLEGLTRLDASTNLLTDLTNVEYLTSLRYLAVAANTISDAKPLGNCTGLEELNISNNQFSDISALESLTGLVNLNFANNQVKTIPAFPTDCALVTIDGSNNLVESLKPLQGLMNLNNIYMDYNTEVSTLKWLAENSTLILVNVYGTKVNSLDQVADLTEHDIIVNFTPIQED